MTPARIEHEAFCATHTGSVSCNCGAVLAARTGNDQGAGGSCLICGYGKSYRVWHVSGCAGVCGDCYERATGQWLSRTAALPEKL